MVVKTIGLAPIILAQALWVMARASRLPEAEGPRQGVLGNGPPKRLLVIGDSSAAGVGVNHQSYALGGRLAEALAQRHRITWQVVAKSGATVKSAQAMLDEVPDGRMDLVLVALGVNDTKNGVRSARWESGYRDLLTRMEAKFARPRICVSGVPPLRHFPLLPHPLSEVLGTRAELFDAILRQIAADREDTVHLSMDFPLEPANMASDGFHPSAKLCREWAQRAARLFLESEA